jgi:cell division protein FtsI (penicillin-binding protein 3)
MSKFDYKNIMPRYSFLAVVMMLIAFAVVGKAAYIMTAKRSYWLKVADRVKRDSVRVDPARGNILSCDGQPLASSLPEFKLFMDFKQLHDAGTDSLWDAKVDSICLCLNQIFPEKSAAEFKHDLNEGRVKQKRHWPVWPKRVNYNTYTEVKALPVFRLSTLKGGFHTEELNARVRPNGSLALRTVGDMYAMKDNGKTPRCGLELSYDSILRGTDGIVHRRKVLNKFLNIMDTPPTDGDDILTTIDVDMQDLAERALLDELKLPEVNGNVGVAIVMEVATGDIKAIVNMEKCIDGKYREIKNHAVSDLLEPGSVFKTASIMTVLEDGYCDTTKMVDTGSGIWPMYGREMRDHNWRRGGYGMMRLPHTLEVSSNVGVSRIIDEYYHDTPEKFVRGIYRTGIASDLHIPIVGSSPARIRMPKKNSHGQWVNWSKTSLPWMSIGYETQIPPISTLSFYNAIANDGKMMQPRFVKAVLRNGEVVKEFPPQVVKGHEQIASPKVIKIMQTILHHVVSQGLGRKAGSPSFQVAGKTGTAQMSKGAAGYRSGTVNYLLSFCGFFPADAPRYSCIVCIQKSGLPASGGGMSGVVFRHIAEGIMARDLKLDAKDAQDSTSILIPDVKSGNVLAADYVLSTLGIKTATNFRQDYNSVKPVWGLADRRSNCVMLTKQGETNKHYIPNVAGMGARDAVYLIEQRGVKCKVEGVGKVVKQSLEPGHYIKRGEVCVLTLE